MQTESTSPSVAVTGLRVLHDAQCDSSFLSGEFEPAAGGRDARGGVSLSTSPCTGVDTGEIHAYRRSTRPHGRVSL